MIFIGIHIFYHCLSSVTSKFLKLAFLVNVCSYFLVFFYSTTVLVMFVHIFCWFFILQQSAIVKKYNTSRDRLRIFFHYQPSYYHVHVHFAHLDYDAPGINAGKAHLLDDVIDNIHLDGKFYQKKTLTFYVNESHELCGKFRQHGELKV